MQVQQIGRGHMEIRHSSHDGSVELRVLGNAERRLTLSRELAAELGSLLVRLTETKH